MLPRRRVIAPAALALLSLLAAACDRPPTEPAADARRPRLATASTTLILAQDLGTLPGDVESEATYVTEDGTVYGRSYASNSSTAPARFFRWTPSGGMVQVSSIPQPPAPPFPTISVVPPLFERAFVLAANAKGEAAGELCEGGCDSQFYDPLGYGGHAFRYSSGAGAQEVDTRRLDPTTPNVVDWTSVAMSINRWGHLAGGYWDSDDPRPFFWTPVDSFRLLLPFLSLLKVSGSHFTGVLGVQINDVDQVFANNAGAEQVRNAKIARVWRPDLAEHVLGFDPSTADICDESCSTFALTQQRAGTLVVGGIQVNVGDEALGTLRYYTHAALWRVPAVNRAGFPSVNANLYSASSTISLASSGGRYYQTYRATQATAAGPYLELVDWGDGTTSRRTRSSVGVTTSQVHTYARRGTYWVRVYVKDAQGRWAVSEHKVTVTA